jgi:hyperosmotically inducible protein
MHITQLPDRGFRQLRHTYLSRVEAAVATHRPAMLERFALPGHTRRKSSGATRIRQRASEWATVAASGARHTLATTSAASRTAGRRPVAMLVVGAAAGALGTYFLDPHAGRRRRGLVRDRFAHMRRVVTRQVPRTVERKSRYVGGVAKGIRHDAVEMVHLDGHHAIVDDETLVARVRSEALRQRAIKAGEIHVDSYEGCVTLRGELEHHAEIQRLIEAVRHVDGVREVRSYLHLPGTVPPNKAESYTRVPAEFARPF